MYTLNLDTLTCRVTVSHRVRFKADTRGDIVTNQPYMFRRLGVLESILFISFF